MSNTNTDQTITSEQMYELENAANDNSHGRQRRCVFFACASPIDELSNLNREEPDVFSDTLRRIEAFKEHIKGLSEMTESAYRRMSIAESR